MSLHAAVLLAAVGVHPRAVGVFEHHGVMVPDVAVLRPDAGLPPAHPPAAHRRLVVHRPGALVEIVHEVQPRQVARKPEEVEPVLDLVLHLGPAGLAGAGPQRAGVAGLLDA